MTSRVGVVDNTALRSSGAAARGDPIAERLVAWRRALQPGEAVMNKKTKKQSAKTSHVAQQRRELDVGELATVYGGAKRLPEGTKDWY